MNARNPFQLVWQKLQQVLASPLEAFTCIYLGPESHAADDGVEEISADPLSTAATAAH